MKKEQEPNCYTCKFFYVTWDKHFPYGCKAMGFKSSRLPSIEVISASGQMCLHYKSKQED